MGGGYSCRRDINLEGTGVGDNYWHANYPTHLLGSPNQLAFYLVMVLGRGYSCRSVEGNGIEIRKADISGWVALAAKAPVKISEIMKIIIRINNFLIHNYSQYPGFELATPCIRANFATTEPSSRTGN